MVRIEYDDIPLLDEADCNDGFNYKNDKYIMNYIERKFEENHYGKVIVYQEDGHLSISFIKENISTDEVVNLTYKYETEAMNSIRARNERIRDTVNGGKVRGYMVGINDNLNSQGETNDV